LTFAFTFCPATALVSASAPFFAIYAFPLVQEKAISGDLGTQLDLADRQIAPESLTARGFIA